LIKDQFFHPENYSNQVDATRWTLNEIGLRILQMYAPYLPHITENLYQEIYLDSVKIHSLHQTKFDQHQKHFEFNLSVEVINTVLAVTMAVRKLKTEHQLSLKTEVQKLIIFCQRDELLGFLKHEQALVKGITKAHAIEYIIGLNDSSAHIIGDGAQLSMMIQI